MGNLDTQDFEISIIGDKSGQKWVGKFSAYRRLSHRQELAKDKYQRELIGGDPKFASERTISQAEVIADLKVCIHQAPQWWKEVGEGLDLVDDNVLSSVWSETVRIRLEALQEVQKKAESAEKALKEIQAEKKD